MSKSSTAYLYEASPPGDFDLNPNRAAALDFSDRDLARMTADDYKAIGFLCGLEVHQQLATRGKLFCRCPSGQRTTRIDATVLRHMRPTLSELGKYDGCALMEFKTRKDIVYLVERQTVCTYELDDTPPFPIDDEAVDVAIEVAQLFNLALVNELHVMRKQYLDGSIPTGFQRTALIGILGKIPFRVPELGVDRELTIRQISLEEDSCREISDRGHTITFRTDRLGTPLTETVTEPELLTPWEAQAAGRMIALITQASGKVRRGAGAARQDVNVSVAGGRRVEIKGVSHHRGLPLLVHIEAFRQLNLLRVKAEIERRGLSRDLYQLPAGGQAWQASPLVADVGEILTEVDHPVVTAALDRGHDVCAVRLQGLKGILPRATQPGRTFADELYERLRVIACLDGRFLLHTDSDHGLPSAALHQIKDELKVTDDDTIALLFAPMEDMETAVREVCARVVDAFDGVPSETRQSHPDGTTGFERILPGPDRMYPDTDTPPIAITDERVARIRSARPDRPWERRERYQQLGLDAELVGNVVHGDWAGLFDTLAPTTKVAGVRLGHALRKRIPYHRRVGGLQGLPPVERLAPLVRAVDQGEIRPEAFELLLDRLIVLKDKPIEEILGDRRVRANVEEDLEAATDDVKRNVTEIRSTAAPARLRWAMGRVMPWLLGRVEPTVVAARLLPLLGGSTETPADV